MYNVEPQVFSKKARATLRNEGSAIQLLIPVVVAVPHQAGKLE
jgi:hypothetical protein